MSHVKVGEALNSQREQLQKLVTAYRESSSNLATLADQIAQLKGAITALEYVQTLDTPDTTPTAT